MLMATKQEIDYIVPEGHCSTWVKIKPYIFYRFGVPFGLIQVVDTHIPIINSISKDDQSFTVAMIRYISCIIKSNERVIVMSTVSDSPALNRLMDKYHEDGVTSYFSKGL